MKHRKYMLTINSDRCRSEKKRLCNEEVHKLYISNNAILQTPGNNIDERRAIRPDKLLPGLGLVNLCYLWVYTVCRLFLSTQWHCQEAILNWNSELNRPNCQTWWNAEGLSPSGRGGWDECLLLPLSSSAYLCALGGYFRVPHNLHIIYAHLPKLPP